MTTPSPAGFTADDLPDLTGTRAVITGANSGISRRGWIPAARLKSGVLATAFATPGTFDATRAAWSISPNA